MGQASIGIGPSMAPGSTAAQSFKASLQGFHRSLIRVGLHPFVAARARYEFRLVLSPACDRFATRSWR